MKPFAQRRVSGTAFFIIAVVLYVAGFFALVTLVAAGREVPSWVHRVAPMTWTILLGIPFAGAMMFWATRRFRGAFLTLCVLTGYAGVLTLSPSAALPTGPLLWWVGIACGVALMVGGVLRRRANDAAVIQAIEDARPKPPPVPSAEERLLELLHTQHKDNSAKALTLRDEVKAESKLVSSAENVLRRCINAERALEQEVREHLMLVRGLRGEELETAMLSVQRKAAATFEQRYRDAVEVARARQELFGGREEDAAPLQAASS